ncbi:MAG: hypothetical protein Q9175_005339 [Cornicularia normoerica]
MDSRLPWTLRANSNTNGSAIEIDKINYKIDQAGLDLGLLSTSADTLGLKHSKRMNMRQAQKKCYP